MLTSLVVKGYLSALDSPLTSIETSLGKGLYCIRNVCQHVNSLVDDSKSADSKDGDEFQAPG